MASDVQCPQSWPGILTRHLYRRAHLKFFTTVIYRFTTIYENIDYCQFVDIREYVKVKLEGPIPFPHTFPAWHCVFDVLLTSTTQMECGKRMRKRDVATHL